MDHQKFPLLAGLSNDERERFAALCERVAFPDGVEFIQEGTHGTCIYLVLDGRLQVFTRSNGGREHELALVDAPAVIGEMEAFTGDHRAASVRAVGEVTALSLGFEQLRARLDEGDPIVAKVVFETGRIVARRLAAMNSRFAELRQHPTADKVRELGEFHRKLLEDWSV